MDLPGRKKPVTEGQDERRKIRERNIPEGASAVGECARYSAKAHQKVNKGNHFHTKGVQYGPQRTGERPLAR